MYILLLILLMFPAGCFALTAEQFESSKITMRAVYPRPDTETASWARHRLAYADGVAQYRIPVAVLGGAYPYYYSLISAPEGATIETDWNAQDYGVITWTPTTTGGPYTMIVRVTDQESTSIDVSWTVTATTSTDYFIFVDGSVGDSGDGSKASPLKTIADVHMASPTDATYGGKILYFLAGTYTLSGPETNNNLGLTLNRKPAVWLGYTGEQVTIDCSGSKILVDDQNDVFVNGLTFANARTDVNDAHFFFFNQNASQDRMTFYDVDFDNIGRGLTGTDNPAAITFFNPGAIRNYYTLWGCSIDDYSSPITDVYAVQYGVIENNTLLTGKTSDVGQGIFLKSDVQDFSVRRNVSLTQGFEYGSIELLMQSQLFPCDNIEIAYNIAILPTTSDRAIVYNWQTAEGYNSTPDVFVYRNSVAGRIQGLDYFPYNVLVAKNAAHTNQSPFPESDGTYINTTDGGNIYGASGIINTSTGAVIDQQYAGLYGSHLASFDGGGSAPRRLFRNLRVSAEVEQ